MCFSTHEEDGRDCDCLAYQSVYVHLRVNMYIVRVPAV